MTTWNVRLFSLKENSSCNTKKKKEEEMMPMKTDGYFDKKNLLKFVNLFNYCTSTKDVCRFVSGNEHERMMAKGEKKKKTHQK